jgi:diguanylate cyclase (GGDEF)-like protein
MSRFQTRSAEHRTLSRGKRMLRLSSEDVDCASARVSERLAWIQTNLSDCPQIGQSSSLPGSPEASLGFIFILSDLVDMRMEARGFGQLRAIVSNGGAKVLRFSCTPSASAAQPMVTRVTLEMRQGSCLRSFASFRQTWFVALMFATLAAIQALGFLVLGTGRAGAGLSESVLVLDSLVALACVAIAFRRARGIPAVFWFLFAAVLAILLVPTAVQACATLLDQTILSDSTQRLLYCLYGAPILMMLCLPTHRRAHVKYEIFLDLFQVAIVVGLIYSTFFFLPVERMLPADALLRNVSISDEQSVLLLAAAFVRLQFVRAPGARNLLLRLVLFVQVCAVVTVVGDWIDVHHYAFASAWFDLGWAVPQFAAGLIALTWSPSPEPQSDPQEPANFLSFLGTNLVLVAVLSCTALLMDRWKQAYGEALASAAIAVSLLAFTLRLALTQFHQHQEIAKRKAAQRKLTVSHLRVDRLLEGARRQTAEITQISELGSLLHACDSQEEVFRLVPDRLRRLFPDASGCIALLDSSKNRVKSVSEWGTYPSDHIFSLEDCWALRRGCVHSHPRGHSVSRCSHLVGAGASVCIPLVANGAAMGMLTIEDSDLLSPVPNSEDADSDAFARRRQLADSVAEHIAVAVANIGLRESLRVQAVRDALTGLYNRRYMQEFLDRELSSARRKHRPLAVMMLDLDHFKRYNDSLGHAAGDQALAIVGETLLRCVRAEDVACRYGGEEFCLILAECSLRQATVRAEEIRSRLKEHCAQRGHHDLTVSIGVAAFDETTDQVDLLLKFADDALYNAKRAGRDRVVVARPAATLPESCVDRTDPTATPLTIANK